MSDEWRLMVDLALLSPKDAPVKRDAVDPRLHAQRYQAPELVVADAPLRAGYAQVCVRDNIGENLENSLSLTILI